jgi:predicted RNA-binding protein with PUA domain
MTDPVNKVPHYNEGEIECIAAIEASMSPEEFLGALKFNVMKYTWRYRKKGKGANDLAKAQYYLNLLAERVKAQEQRAADAVAGKKADDQRKLDALIAVAKANIPPVFAQGGVLPDALGRVAVWGDGRPEAVIPLIQPATPHLVGGGS